MVRLLEFTNTEGEKTYIRNDAIIAVQKEEFLKELYERDENGHLQYSTKPKEIVTGIYTGSVTYLVRDHIGDVLEKINESYQ